MRAWIILTGFFIALAIRPGLDSPAVMGKMQFSLFIVFFFGGLYADAIEFIMNLKRKRAGDN